MLERLKQLFKKPEEVQPTVEDKIEEAFNSLGEDVIRLEIGSDIAEFAEAILEKINDTRDEIKEQTGFVYPLVHVIEKEDDLQENEAVFFIRGQELAHDFLIPTEEAVASYIYESLMSIFENYIDEIFTMEYFEKYVTKVQTTNSWLVWDISRQLGVYEMKTVLVNILKEKKSISDINRVFEKIDECLAEDRDWCRVWKADVISKRICKEI